MASLLETCCRAVTCRCNVVAPFPVPPYASWTSMSWLRRCKILLTSATFESESTGLSSRRRLALNSGQRNRSLTLSGPFVQPWDSACLRIFAWTTLLSSKSSFSSVFERSLEDFNDRRRFPCVTSGASCDPVLPSEMPSSATMGGRSHSTLSLEELLLELEVDKVEPDDSLESKCSASSCSGCEDCEDSDAFLFPWLCRQKLQHCKKKLYSAPIVT